MGKQPRYQMCRYTCGALNGIRGPEGGLNTICSWKLVHWVLQKQAMQRACQHSGHCGLYTGPVAPSIFLTSAAVPCANRVLCLLTACALALQKQFNAERVAALLEDRRIREQDEQAHAALAAQRIDELQQRLKNTERALQQATKDYILGGQLLKRKASQLQQANARWLAVQQSPKWQKRGKQQALLESLTRHSTPFSCIFL